jgi:cephalosporin hydroxylase
MEADITIFEIMKFCEELGVQQRVEEFCVIAGILIAARPKNILEIGVYGGGSFAMWCYLASGKKIGIDSGSIGGPIHQRVNDFRSRFAEVSVLKGDSHDPIIKQEVLNILDGEGLDFLFIDGDHSLEGVKLDYEMYSPLVAKGGWVGFHDVTESAYHKNMNAGGSAQHWLDLQHPRKIHINWRDPGFGVGIIQLT